MELWVRSQDREHLVQTTDIDLSSEDKTVILINCYEMAKYKTKERALEVLDEIESILIFNRLEKVTGKNFMFVENNVAVYEMPLD